VIFSRISLLVVTELIVLRASSSAANAMCLDKLIFLAWGVRSICAGAANLEAITNAEI